MRQSARYLCRAILLGSRIERALLLSIANWLTSIQSHHVKGYSTDTTVFASNANHCKVQEVTDYGSLVSELEPHLPHSMKLHQSARLTQLGKYANQHFYRISGQETGFKPTPNTVFLWTRRRHQRLTAVSIFAPEGSSYEILEPVLDDGPVIDWTERIIFSGIRKQHYTLIKKLVEKHGNMRRVSHTELLACPIEKARAFDVTNPSEAFLAPLRPQDAQLLTSTWKFADPETQEYILDIISEGLTTGLYLKDGNQLVSWAVVQPFGGIGMFETLPSHQGRGYGSLTLSFIMRMVADIGMIPYVYVEKDNNASKNVLFKLGFQPVEASYWVYYLPPSSQQ